MEINNINEMVNQMDEYHVYPRGYKSGRIGQKEVMAFLQDSFNLSVEEKNIIIYTWNNIWRKYGNKGVPKSVFKKELKNAFGISKTRPQLQEIKNDIDNNEVSNINNNEVNIDNNIFKEQQNKQEEEINQIRIDSQKNQEINNTQKSETISSEEEIVKQKEGEEGKKDISIKFSSDKYKNGEEFKKFNDYCEKQGKNPVDFLSKIHKKMGISEEDFMYFGPKTIKYLEENIYKKTEEQAEEQVKVKEQTKEQAEEQLPKIDISNIELKLGDNRYKEEFDILKEKITKKEIINIQREMGLDKNDYGFIGEKTIKYIYAKHPKYFLNSKKDSIRERAKRNISLNNNKIEGKTINGKNIKEFIIKELNEYKNKTIEVNGKTVHPENAYQTYINLSTKSKYYYGIAENNKPGKKPTISAGLEKIEKSEKLKGVEKISNAYLLKTDNKKYALVLFRGGKLAFATYASPGKTTPTTKVNNARLGNVDITHISSSEQGIEKDKDGNYTGWVMPYSVPIAGTNGEAVHASLVVNGHRASHGCIRIPPYYAKIFSEYQKALSIKLTTIDV